MGKVTSPPGLPNPKEEDLSISKSVKYSQKIGRLILAAGISVSLIMLCYNHTQGTLLTDDSLFWSKSSEYWIHLTVAAAYYPLMDFLLPKKYRSLPYMLDTLRDLVGFAMLSIFAIGLPMFRHKFFWVKLWGSIREVDAETIQNGLRWVYDGAVGRVHSVLRTLGR